MLTKRLEEGTFAWPKAAQAGAVKLKLTTEALALLTDGVDLRGAKLRPWYEREQLDESRVTKGEAGRRNVQVSKLALAVDS